MSTSEHADQAWARLRPHITRLYLDEARPLKEVVETMRIRHDFDATPRMYKHRLQKWGLDKKYKEKEVIQMLLLKQQRSVAGKQSIFLRRGRKVDWEQVEKYLRRRPDLETKIKSGMLKMSGSNADITCRSPSPVLHISSVLQYTDELLRLLHGYYHSNFHGAANKAHGDQAGDHSVTIRCWRRLNQAHTMIMDNMINPGFQALNKSLDDLGSIVEEQDPTLIFYLCDFVSAFDQRHKALTSELLRHIYNTLFVVFGEGHPLVWLLRRLICLSGKDRNEVIAAVLEAAVDDFKRILISDRLIERLNCHYMVLLDSMGIRGRIAKDSFPEMNLASMDAVSVVYLGRFVERLIFSCEFEEAGRKTDIMLAWLQSPLNQQNPAWADLQLFYYRLKAHGEFSSGDDVAGLAWIHRLQQFVAQYFPNM
ncbi:Clr5 domain-containing protein [Dactylonectria estremocensis]|uniref:Clr5 domain-containing protein n=1 Tax=Dactylonectria estremocensis TaxID=1079267 RepID=A0A9P9EST8_9HYPO|nr:Clr5 domain-containing protein [Dactylonectria estremocensis]